MNLQSDLPNSGEKLQRLDSRIRQLLMAYQAIQAHVQKLEEENIALKKELEDKNHQLKDFQYQLEISKLVNSVGEEQKGVEEIRDKIDEYIKEIDHCIHFLNQEL